MKQSTPTKKLSDFDSMTQKLRKMVRKYKIKKSDVIAAIKQARQQNKNH
jgi:hypothetical protein